MTAARDTRVDGCAAPSDWFAVLPQTFPQRGWFCTWRATYKGRFCFKAMCAKGVVAKVMPGRVSGRGWVPMRRSRRAVATAATSRPCYRCHPIAIALSQPRFARQQRGASEFPFACAPPRGPLVGGSYSARAPVMASAASQAVAAA